MTGREATGDDPLYAEVALPHEGLLPVLGVPVRFAANDRALLQIVDRWFGRWASVPAELRACDGVTVRLILHEGREARGGPITYRMPDRTRFFLHTAGSLGVVDIERRDAVAYVSRALVADTERFGYGVLEAMTLLLVARQDRQPVHAAMVARDSNALLLAGPTGVGKSTVAYAAHRAGWRVLSDDSVYVQRRPQLRVWGMPGRMYLLAEARRHFPGERRRARRLPSGKRKVSIELESAWGPGAPVVRRVGVCLLTRDGGGVASAVVSPEQATTFLRAGLGSQVYWYEASIGPALSALCARGGWRLNLSGDPVEALPLLERMLGELEGGG
jgi:hypothetical protein